MPPRLLLQLIILSFLTTAGVKGHVVEQIYLSLEQSGRTLQLDITFDAAYATPELRNDRNTAQPSREWLVQRNTTQHQELRDGAEAYLRESIHLKCGSEEIDYQITFPGYASLPPEFPQLLNGGAYFIVRLVSHIPADQYGEVTMAIHSGERPNFIIATRNAETTGYIVIKPNQSATIYTTTTDGQTAISTPSLLSVFWLGFRHVLPNGLDHILFILALFLMLRSWRPLAAQSLVFTIAHSITLGLAASGVIQTQQWGIAWAVEPLIAFSIFLIAIESIFTQRLKPYRLALIFSFGLIHGLGFAGSLGTTLHKGENWLAVLAAVNIGVEASQIALLLAAWCLTAYWWDSPLYKHFRIRALILIALIGLWWTVSRLLY